MEIGNPRLSIGMPVYNGERYIREALDSILSQTFDDFELIISDNASADSTAEICKEYALKDRRIRFYQNSINLGAVANFNLVFELSTGEYFKWAAHDDLLHPEFLRQCIKKLDQDSSIILCHSKVFKIDQNGNKIGSHEIAMASDAQKPHERFHELVNVNHSCTAIFGVIRRELLANTNLIGKFVGSDRILLAELGLYGRIIELPEYLFYQRDHAQASSRINYYRRMSWFDPKKSGYLSLPNFRKAVEYFRSATRVPLKWRERVSCYRSIVRWIIHERNIFIEDFKAILINVWPISTINQYR